MYQILYTSLGQLAKFFSYHNHFGGLVNSPPMTDHATIIPIGHVIPIKRDMNTSCQSRGWDGKFNLVSLFIKRYPHMKPMAYAIDIINIISFYFLTSVNNTGTPLCHIM